MGGITAMTVFCPRCKGLRMTLVKGDKGFLKDTAELL